MSPVRENPYFSGYLGSWLVDMLQKHRMHLKSSARAALKGYHHSRLTIGETRHIHVVRESAERRNWAFFQWLETKHPDISNLFRHTTAYSLCSTITNNTALFLPWIQDPLKERNHALFLRMKELETQYERQSIPIINPVELLSNSIKSRALDMLRRAGLRTAKVVQIGEARDYDAIASRVGLPFIVRNDLGHGGYVRLVRGPGNFRGLDWDQLRYPIALEFLDTQSEAINTAFTVHINRLNCLPLKEGSVDRVGSLAGLHHICDKSKFFNEAYRVLKPGGILAIRDVLDRTPVAQFLNGPVDIYTTTDHYGFFLQEEECSELLSWAGFTEVKEEHRSFYWKFRSIEQMVKYCKSFFGMSKATEQQVYDAITCFFNIETTIEAVKMSWSLFYCIGLKNT